MSRKSLVAGLFIFLYNVLGDNMFNSRKRKHKRQIIACSFTFIAVFAAAIVLLEVKIRPVLATIAESRAKNIAIEAVNDAVWQVLSDDNINYNSLVSFTYTQDTTVNAVLVDSVKLNTVCAEIRSRITDYFSNLSERTIDIPIGSLTGVDLLAGKGPSVNIGITLSGSAQTEVINDFETAGINQTRHQIILKVKTKIYIIMQSGNITTETENSIIIAETVIVGEVPEIYSDGSNDELWQNLVGYE